MLKIWKTIRSTLSVCITLSIIFGAGYYVGRYYKNGEAIETIASVDEGFDLKLPGEAEKRIITVEEVETVLVEIGQLATYSGEYTVTKGNDYTRHFLDDIAIPGSTNSINIECTGVVKVGYNIEDIAITVDNDSLKIYISLPEVQVLDNYVIWDTVNCQEENNILNPIDFGQYQELIPEIESAGLAQAEAEGIYERAETNMEMIIRNFLSGFVDFEVVFL